MKFQEVEMTEKTHYSEFKFILGLIVKFKKNFNTEYKVLIHQMVQQNVLTNDIVNIDLLYIKLEEIKNSFNSFSSNALYKYYFNEDIDTLKKIIEDYNESFDNLLIENLNTRCLQILNKEFGTQISQLPEIFLVENFPEPYDKISTWDFMYATRDDAEKYNIKEGLYIHKERQFPIYGEYLIIHELVHYFVDQIKDNKVIKYRWIEESVANWFSLKIYSQIIDDIDSILFIKDVNELYNQIFPFSAIAEYSYYDDVLRNLYYIGGNKAINKFCLQYFAQPTSIEWQHLFVKLINKDFASLVDYNFSHDTEKVGDLILATQSYRSNVLFLTSAEYTILKHIGVEKISLKEISKTSSVDLKLIKRGATQLQSRGYLISEDDDIELIDNVAHLLELDLFKISYV